MPIYTAGYGNLGFEGYLERLKALEVTHLVDVRRIPGSKYWVDFCRPRLEDLLQPTGIRYVWMGDTIGGIGDRETPLDANGQPDYEFFWRDPVFQKGLDKVQLASQKRGWQVCLMCGCLRPQNCHRGFLIGPAFLDRGVEIVHVEADGGLVPHSEAMRAVQASLF